MRKPGQRVRLGRGGTGVVHTVRSDGKAVVKDLAADLNRYKPSSMPFAHAPVSLVSVGDSQPASAG